MGTVASPVSPCVTLALSSCYLQTAFNNLLNGWGKRRKESEEEENEYCSITSFLRLATQRAMVALIEEIWGFFIGSLYK